MPDTPTTFEAALSNRGKLSTTKKSSFQYPCDAQYFRLFLDANINVKTLQGALPNSLLQQEKLNGKANVLVLNNCSILVIIKEPRGKTTRNYFFSYGGGKRISLKRKTSY